MMSIVYEDIVIQSVTGHSLTGTLSRNDSIFGGPRRLMVQFAGRGYTHSHPLLHYLTQIGLEMEWDVLQAPYYFQVYNEPFSADQMPLIFQDSQLFLSAVLQNHYSEIMLVGKSLGTPIASMLAPDISGGRVSLLLLTPVQNAAQMAQGMPTLAVIGTADAAYDPQTCVSSGSVAWKVHDGLNHSLEARGDWQRSLQVLPRIMQDCADFVLAQSV